VILKTNLVKIDAVVGPFDAAVGKMLEAIAEIVLPLRTEAGPGAEVIAELEGGAESFVSE
jgi:hypothetical protein